MIAPIRAAMALLVAMPAVAFGQTEAVRLPFTSMTEFQQQVLACVYGNSAERTVVSCMVGITTPLTERFEEGDWDALNARIAAIGPDAQAALPPPSAAAPAPPRQSDLPTAMPQQPREWSMREERDPITLRPSFFASHVGIHPDGYPFTGRRIPSLLIRCRNSRLEVYATFEGSFSFMRDFVRAEVRVGQQAGQAETWSPSSSREAIFAPDPQALLTRMLAADEMVIRVPLEGVGFSTVHYDLRQLRGIVAPLRQACPAPRPAPQQPRQPAR